jgi:hypothetical protein
VPSVVAFLASATVAGINSGRLGKDVLRAGLTTAATAAAFYVVGGMTNMVGGQAFGAEHMQPAFGTAAYDFNVVTHAAVGCGASVASGGKCGPVTKSRRRRDVQSRSSMIAENLGLREATGTLTTYLGLAEHAISVRTICQWCLAE